MTMGERFAGYLLQVLATTIVQLFTLFGPALILVALLSVAARFVTRLAIRAFGTYLYLLLFGWLGTAIHELGHAIFLLLFGYRVARVDWFKIDTKSGTWGQTFYELNQNSLFKVIGLFFVGIAPILFGTTLIFIALLILFQSDMVDLMRRISELTSDTQLQSGVSALLYQTLAYCLAILAFIFSPAHLADWRFYLFLYLAFAIGSSIRLSGKDIEGAAEGFLALGILVLLFNFATLWQGGLAAGSFSLLSQSYAFLYVILGLALLLNLLAALILFVPAAVLGGR